MYKRIIVPVDGSPTATKALVAALQLARDGGGRVRLIHVVEELAFVDGYDMYGGQTGELLQVMREAGDKVLDAALEIARSSGVEADKQLFDRFGERLGEVVANAAREWNADLIVLGTHGRRGIGRVLLGSGAEQIIRLAPTPVLVIRSGDETTPRPA
jgi:nucleotide-binding universal stress UspA family protein